MGNLKDWEIKKRCWEQKFFVVQIPTGTGWSKKPFPVQLQMDLQGQLKMGEHSYEQNSEALTKKIDEMYLYMYKRFVS